MQIITWHWTEAKLNAIHYKLRILAFFDSAGDSGLMLAHKSFGNRLCTPGDRSNFEQHRLSIDCVFMNSVPHLVQAFLRRSPYVSASMSFQTVTYDRMRPSQVANPGLSACKVSYGLRYTCSFYAWGCDAGFVLAHALSSATMLQNTLFCLIRLVGSAHIQYTITRKP